MATFGYTTKGTAGETTVAERMFAGRFTLTEDGVITKITAYLIAREKMKITIYNDDGGSPGSPTTLEATTNEVDVPLATDGWVDFTFAVNPTLPAGIYHLAILGSNIGTQKIVYDAGAVEQCHYKDITYDGAPDPFGASTHLDRVYSIYATYTPSLGGGSVSNVSLISLGLGAWLAMQKKKKRMKKSVLAKKIAREAMKPMVKYLKKVDEAIKKAV